MEKRIQKLREKLREVQVDGILITSQTNRRYITGFTGSAGYVLITQQRAILITDFRYIDQAKKQSSSFEVVKHSGPIIETIKNELGQLGLKTLGFEEDFVTYSLYKTFQSAFKEQLIPLRNVIEQLRLIKDDGELHLIKEATKIADSAFSFILDEIKPGIREIDVALKLECKMRELGAEGASFDTIVASGIRSALPHGVASEKMIQKGELVTMDFGAIYKGYVSDITRTVMVGQPNEKQQEIYNIVLEAQLNGVYNVKAGMTGKEADSLTRNIITDYGYGDFFGHSTGHGIGLDVHEGPGLSYKNDNFLQSGMVVTVEPGIYITDFGGVRIEDDVFLTENGREILTKSTKDLIIID